MLLHIMTYLFSMKLFGLFDFMTMSPSIVTEILAGLNIQAWHWNDEIYLFSPMYYGMLMLIMLG
jgi:hypothetical protein